GASRGGTRARPAVASAGGGSGNSRGGTRRTAGADGANAGKARRSTARGKAGPAHGGFGSPRASHAFVRNYFQSGRRGDGRQPERHAQRLFRAAEEEAEDERGGCVRIPDPGRREQAD